MPPLTTVSVHLLPALIPEEALGGAVAVVIDVLRATTVMVNALASGCRAIVPCQEIDDARRAAASVPEGSAILAGERQGVAIEGFDLGNSPGDFGPEACRDKLLVMTTTNGTKAILASAGADRLLIGAFVNLSAVVRAVRDEARQVHLVCAGTDGLVSLEDSLLAGAIVEQLLSDGRWAIGNDSALLAMQGWKSLAPARPEPSVLTTILESGRGGRRVIELGLGDDIGQAAWIDRIDLVPELRQHPLRIVAPGAPGRSGIG